MNRSDIPGNEALKNAFVRMVDDHRLPHAILIHGSEGGSGLPLGMFLMQYLLCQQPEGGDVCGVCSSCQKNAGLTHPDVHFMVPVNTNGKQVKKTEDVITDNYMDQWRKAATETPFMTLQDWYRAIGIESKQGFMGTYEGKNLQKKLSLKSYEGRHKVFIMWHADRMNPTFANKILKNLEEPNKHNVFILISESPGKLISTISSRVQTFQEEQPTHEIIAEFLERQFNLDQAQASAAAFRADDQIQQAVHEVTNSGESWLDDFRTWMRMAWKRDMIGLYKWSEGMAKRTRDDQKQYVHAALKMLDRCFRMAWIDLPLPLEGEEAKFFKDFSPFINAANIHGFLEMLEETSFHIERNVNQKMIWYDTSIQAVRLIHEGKKLAAST